MSAILGPLLVLGFLIGIYALIFSGGRGRVGRPPSGVLTRLRSPTDAPLGVAALSGLALGGMVTVTDPHADGQSGLAIGVVLAVTLAMPAIQHLTLAACGLVGVIVAVWEALRFTSGEGSDGLVTAYRVALMALILACFGASVVIFGRGSALRGERGLALFGLVEVITFLAHPGNRDSLSLDGVGHATFLVVACGVACVLGWAASEYVLGIVALAVATATMLTNATVGDANAAWVGLVAAASAVVLTVAARALFDRSS